MLEYKVMKSSIPEIRIKYAKFLDPIFIGHIKSTPEWNDWTPPNKDEVIKAIENYKNEWSLCGEKILVGMCEILNLEFKQNIIDVYVVSGTLKQFSDPIVIKSGLSLDRFISVLVHELIHKLFQNNIDIFPVSILSEMFPEESKTTKNHIITYSVLKYICINILKDEIKLKNNYDRISNTNNKDYIRAWEIMEQKGYLNLIKELRDKIETHS